MSQRLSRLYSIVDVELAERAGRAPRDLARAYLAGGARLLQERFGARVLLSAADWDLLERDNPPWKPRRAARETRLC